jgi:TolB protein
MKKIFIFMLFAINLIAYDATIEIVKNIEKERTISVVDSSNTSGVFNKKLLKLIIGDLKVSAHFKVNGSIDKSPFDSTTSGIGGDIVLKTNIKKEGGKLLAEVKLLNVKNSQLLYEKFYSISKEKRYPFLAHNIVIDLNDFFALPSIAWMKKYIVFAKYTQSGKSEIVVSDYTLSFKKTIVTGGLNIFPKWADDKQESFYYTSYSGFQPTLYHVNLFSGEKRKITSSSGMLVCSDVSNDGTKLLLTMAPNDQPDIYLYDTVTGSKKKLTKYRGIDVSGSFVDNDSAIVFISERLGYPNIFSKSINGGKVEQMVYHGKNNSSCTSFDKYIVYSSRDKKSSFGKGTFNLYLISTQTDFIRKLTNSGKNLFPRFSNDGQSVMYIKYMDNRSALGILRLNANRSFLFPLNAGKIQSLDW